MRVGLPLRGVCALEPSPFCSRRPRPRDPVDRTIPAAFAALARVAPLEASSGQRTRHRLSRAGDRDLNRALHTVAITRLRCHDESRAYETNAPPRARRIETSAAASNARSLDWLYRRIQAATHPAAAFNGLAHAA